MAVAITNVTSGNAQNATSATTASISPTTNNLILLSVASRTGITANPNQPTATGLGLTWVAINSIVYDTTSSSRKRVTLLRALGTVSNGTIVIDFGGQTQTDIAWVIDQGSGIDTSGTNGSGAVLQSAINSDEVTTGPTLTTTLSAFSNVNNATYGAFADSDPSIVITAGSGFSKLTRGSSGTGCSTQTEWKSTNDTTVDMSWASGTQVGGIGIEIVANSAGTTSNFSRITSIKPRRPIINTNIGLTSKLIFDMPMWEKTGNITDLINKFSGILKNTPLWKAGWNGPILNFISASTQYIDIAFNAKQQPSDFLSIEAVVDQPDWTSTVCQVICATSESGGYSLLFNDPAQSANTMSFVVRANGVYNYATASIPSSWAANTYHHFLGTFDGRLVKIYFDGVLQTTTDLGAPFAIQYSVSNSVCIGCDPDTNSPIVTAGATWNSNMLYVRMWNRAVTAPEVKMLYSNPFLIYKRI